MSPRVVAVAGASGAGKSSLIRALCDRFERSRSIHFDDYFPGDRAWDDRAWLDAGAPLDDIETPAMVAELAARRADPTLELVCVEEPFGRGRAAIAPLVDFVVNIELPLDVALARIIGRAVTSAGDPARGLERIGRLIDGYLDRHRRLYRLVSARVAADCDLVVDGELPIEELADAVKDALTSAPW